jgi:hypothetical protein
MIFFSTSWAQWLFPLGREHVGCVSDRIFTLATYTHIDFIQDNNDVGRLACLLSLVKHSRYWILLFDEMINYCSVYSMGSLNFWCRITVAGTYIHTCFMREKLIDSLICLHFVKGLTTWLT